MAEEWTKVGYAAWSNSSVFDDKETSVGSGKDDLSGVRILSLSPMEAICCFRKKMARSLGATLSETDKANKKTLAKLSPGQFKDVLESQSYVMFIVSTKKNLPEALSNFEVFMVNDDAPCGGSTLKQYHLEATVCPFKPQWPEEMQGFWKIEAMLLECFLVEEFFACYLMFQNYF